MANARDHFVRRWLRRFVWLSLAAFVALNVIAAFHARAMLTFVVSGARTPGIERLSTAQKIGVLLTGVRIPKPDNYRTPADEGLAFTTNILHPSGRGDLEAWKIPCTNPRAAVAMFHGYADCKASLLAEARAFHEQGCEVWLLDFQGSGGSGGNSTSFGWHEAEDVKTLFDFVRAQDGRRPVLLYGFSMGSAAILRAVADLGVRPDGIVIAATFDTMAGAARQRFHSMGIPSFPSAQCLIFWGGVQQGMNAFMNNPAEFAARVNCPALVLHGSADVRAPLEMGSNVYARLAGPKRMAVFEGAGHGPLEKFGPEKWKKEVSAWMDGVTGASIPHR